MTEGYPWTLMTDSTPVYRKKYKVTICNSDPFVTYLDHTVTVNRLDLPSMTGFSSIPFSVDEKYIMHMIIMDPHRQHNNLFTKDFQAF